MDAFLTGKLGNEVMVLSAVSSWEVTVKTHVSLYGHFPLFHSLGINAVVTGFGSLLR